MKLSNREEDNLFYKVRKNTDGKNISDSCYLTVRTTEEPNNKTAPTRKEKFQTHAASFKLDSTENKLNKRKNSSLIIREIDTPVSTKTVSSKPSRVDFDIVIEKPSRQESHRSSKTKNAM